MISSRRSMFWPPNSPSIESAKASSVIAPVSSTASVTPSTAAKNGGIDSHTPPIITSIGKKPITTLAKGKASAMRERLGSSCGRSPVGSRE